VRMVELGFLDDRRYARALIRRLRGRGSSQRRISARLREKGIDGSLRGELVAELAEGDSELEAARVYARRRRLGGYRRGRESGDPCETSASKDEDREARRLRRQRELGALSRAGFDFDVASRALDSE
ncbi:MAG: RecX family transcriptional regulator, partial [Myxococcota bacterium]|nr:RecX family transcriptional regulator [Myxococcota bacterium]